ncbi:archease [Anaeromyxobacter oryzisoli]|uniref:archease n=1 Tax=Anaeromyxobacter oryzisoli TaxID=2925408 RepID=UPI001F588019|nr:archease [Anaeromyxobacter sp. SG63]
MHGVTAAASHSFEEHRSELEIRIEAPSLPALFAEAGRSLVEVMHGTPLEAPGAWSDEIVVTARDREALLVEWLNELVFRAEVAKVLFTEFEIGRLSQRELVATVRGSRVSALRNPVKAATYHGLAIAAAGEGFTAKVILDV